MQESPPWHLHLPVFVPPRILGSSAEKSPTKISTIFALHSNMEAVLRTCAILWHYHGHELGCQARCTHK